MLIHFSWNKGFHFFYISQTKCITRIYVFQIIFLNKRFSHSFTARKEYEVVIMKMTGTHEHKFWLFRKIEKFWPIVKFLEDGFSLIFPDQLEPWKSIVICNGICKLSSHCKLPKSLSFNSLLNSTLASTYISFQIYIPEPSYWNNEQTNSYVAQLA